MGTDLDTLLGKIAATPWRKAPLHLVGTARFELKKRLGGGAFGEVYEARDREHGSVVALKTLKSAQPDWVYRFKREFRTTADLAHPNLVRLYELFSEGDSWYLTMELIDGLPLDRYLRRVPEALHACFAQLALGIHELHRAGCLHRDLKPTNALVEATGRLVLLDYGLAIPQRSKERTAVAGTPPYMAPELGLGLAPSEASDWYAFGVMLYEALTGELPFTGSNVEMLARKTSGQPPPTPASLVPGCDAELSSLAMQLLARAPDERPSADEILRVLSGEGSEQFARRHAPPTLVGRAAELAQLEAALGDSREHAVVLAVRGQPGMGKTALVNTFLDRARAKGARVYQGRCLELDAVPFKGVDAAIDMLCVDLKHRRSSAVAELVPEGAASLSQMFPVLKRLEAFAKARRAGPEARSLQESRKLGASALRELLTRISVAEPVVLFIDDLQWGDDDGVGLLLELLVAPSPRFLLVVAYREGSAGQSSVLARFLAELTAHGAGPREIALGGLDRAAIAELFAAAPEVTISEDVALRETGGHPYLLSRLLAGAPTGEDRDVAQLIADEIAQLGPDARAVLELVSAAGTPLRQQVVLAAAGVRTDPALLDQLRRRRLIHAQASASDAYVEVYHDRVREVALAPVAPEARRELHRRIATTLEELGLADPESLTRHYREACMTDQALAWTRRAAEHATAAFAFARAASLYAEALQLPLEPAQRLDLLVELAGALEQSGRREDAGATSLQAASLALELGRPERHAALRARAGEQLLLAGKHDEGLELLRDVLAAVGVDLPASPAVAVAESFNVGGALAARGLEFQPRDVGALDPHRLQQVDLELEVARSLALSDLRAPLMAMRALSAALETGESRRIQRALAYFVLCLSARSPGDELVVAAEARAHALARSLGDEEGAAWADLATGFHAMHGEELVNALEALDGAERRFMALGPAFAREATMARIGMVIVCGNHGVDLPYARAIHAGCIEGSLARGDLFNAAWARFAECMFALASDDVARARMRLREARTTWPRITDSLFGASALMAELTIALYADPPTAWDTLASIEPEFRALFSSMMPLPRQVWCRLSSGAALAAHGAGVITLDEALRRITALRDELESAGARGASYLVVQSHLALLRGERASAAELLQRAAVYWAGHAQGAWGLLAMMRVRQLRGETELQDLSIELFRLGVTSPERMATLVVGPRLPT